MPESMIKEIEEVKQDNDVIPSDHGEDSETFNFVLDKI